MNGLRIGYIRVSTVEQNTQRQLADVPLDKVFEEKISGASKQRPALASLIDYAREGDEVLVHSLDRLGRNLGELQEIVETLNAKGVILNCVKENLVFHPNINNPMNMLFFQILGALAEFERERILERQAEGIAIAKKKGVYKGRKPSLTPEQVALLHQRLESGDYKTKRALAKEFGISAPTLYRYGN